MKIVKNKATGEVLTNLPKLVNTSIQGILVIDIESAIWLITNNTALDVTEQFEILNDTPEIIDVTDKCALELTFNNPTNKQLEEDYNLITISVSGNSIYSVEFKTVLENWKVPEGNNLNTIIIKVPASGKNEDILARIKGCSSEVKTTVSTIKKIEEVVEEKEVGTIKFSESNIFKFVVKRTNTSLWLLQTDDTRSYFIPRGLNILNDSRVNVDTTKFNKSELSNDLITDEGGLQPFINNIIPSRWERNWWENKGYTVKSNGEWSLSSVITPPVVVPPVITPPVITPPVVVPPNNGSTFSVPVGVIFWDNWERDFWQDSGLSRDGLEINKIGINRLAATEWKHKFDKLVPFYAKHTPPELTTITYDVVFDEDLGRNTYKEVQKYLTVKYDRTTEDRDRELKYYADAGFSWICFNYYSDESYLSTTRRHFVETANKYGLKMTFMILSDREDSEVNYIANLMTKDFWFKIDDKPVLYLNKGNFDKNEEGRYKQAYYNLTGKSLYLVYYEFGGIPMDVADLFNKLSRGVNAISSYNQTSSIKTAAHLIEAEVDSRRDFINGYGHWFQMIPNLTTGVEDLVNRTSISNHVVNPNPICTLEELAKKCKLCIDDIAIYNKDKIQIPAVLWYAGNEILESGLPIVPAKREDGSIDTSVIDTISNFL